MFRSFFKKSDGTDADPRLQEGCADLPSEKKDTTAYFLVNRNIIFWYTENQIEM